ncbi:hypothetical protein G6F50_015265 [Rhizopus delemar]|uniref:Putative DnaT-like domain-containing protein n=1 Tax=Rhizopus delemar TaxID=936053 RepID=A0A9P6XYW8_9FUNG|nr:hypothetical protein G6F50_015265 [Rhizopus delemar]
MYGTLEGADLYHQARGNAAWAAGTDDARTGALVRATDYIDGRYRVLLASGRWASMFPGVRTAGRGQPNEWPRTGAVDYDGDPIQPDEVPDEPVAGLRGHRGSNQGEGRPHRGHLCRFHGRWPGAQPTGGAGHR